MSKNIIQKKWSVILCGGRGQRLGAITDSVPKPLAMIRGKPILWYAIKILYAHGFRKFIFPLGYKGEMIKEYVTEHIDMDDCSFVFKETGGDTPIAGRIARILDIIPEKEDFFLLNGDTLFDFDIPEMYRLHVNKKALLTISSVEHVSSFGMVVLKEGEVVNFVRNARISSLAMSEPFDAYAFVNAGMVWINREAFSLMDMNTCKSFEAEFYPVIIKTGRVEHFRLEGIWYAVDTPKELNAINSDPALYSDIILRLNNKVDLYANKKSKEERRYSVKECVENRAGNWNFQETGNRILPGYFNLKSKV